MPYGEGDLSASNLSTTSASPDTPRELQKYIKYTIKSTIVESHHESSISFSNNRFRQTVSLSYWLSLDDSPSTVTSETREEDSNLCSLNAKSEMISSSDCVSTPSCFSVGNAHFTSNNTALPISLASKTSDSASTSTNLSASAIPSTSTSDVITSSSVCVLTPSRFTLGNVCSSEVTSSSFCKSSASASSYSSLGIATSTPATAPSSFTRVSSVFASASTGMPFQPSNPSDFTSDNRLSNWPPSLPSDSSRLVDFEGLSHDLGNLLEKKLNPDVDLNCKGQTFPAHKSILAARSDFFAGLFKMKIAKSGIQKIAFNDVEPECLGIFLKYVYTGTLQERLSGEMVCQLYAAACKYSVRCLSKACLDFMISSVSKKNYLQFLKVAHHDYKLKEAVALFLTKEREDLLRSSDWWKFTKEEPKIAFEVRYMKYAYDHVPNCLPLLIPSALSAPGSSFVNALSTSLTTAPWSLGSSISTSITTTSVSFGNSVSTSITTTPFSFGSSVSTSATTTPRTSNISTPGTMTSQSRRSWLEALPSAPSTESVSEVSTSATMTSPSSRSCLEALPSAPRTESVSEVSTSATMTSPSSRSCLEALSSARSTESVTVVSTSDTMTSPSSRSWLDALPSAPRTEGVSELSTSATMTSPSSRSCLEALSSARSTESVTVVSTSDTMTSPSSRSCLEALPSAPRTESVSEVSTSATMTSPSSRSWLEALSSARSTESVTVVSTSATMTSRSSRSCLEALSSARSTESVTVVSTSDTMTSPSSRSWLEALPSAPRTESVSEVSTSVTTPLSCVTNSTAPLPPASNMHVFTTFGNTVSTVVNTTSSSSENLAEPLLEAATADRLSFRSTVSASFTTTTSIAHSFVSQSGSLGSTAGISATTTAPGAAGVILPPKYGSIEASSPPCWNTSCLPEYWYYANKEQLSDDLTFLLKIELFPDVRLKCEDQIFPAHRGILATRSSFFENLFRRESDDGNRKEIVIRGLKPGTLRILLKFIYSATLPTLISEDSFCELFSASLKYGVYTLLTVCVDLMIEHVTEENYLKLLMLSDKSNCYCRRLREAIKKFVSDRIYLLKSEDWKRFSDKEPRLADEIYQAVFEDLQQLYLESKT